MKPIVLLLLMTCMTQVAMSRSPIRAADRIAYLKDNAFAKQLQRIWGLDIPNIDPKLNRIVRNALKGYIPTIQERDEIIDAAFVRDGHVTIESLRKAHQEAVLQLLHEKLNIENTGGINSLVQIVGGPGPRKSSLKNGRFRQEAKDALPVFAEAFNDEGLDGLEIAILKAVGLSGDVGVDLLADAAVADLQTIEGQVAKILANFLHPRVNMEVERVEYIPHNATEGRTIHHNKEGDAKLPVVAREFGLLLRLSRIKAGFATIADLVDSTGLSGEDIQFLLNNLKHYEKYGNLILPRNLDRVIAGLENALGVSEGTLKKVFNLSRDARRLKKKGDVEAAEEKQKEARALVEGALGRAIEDSDLVIHVNAYDSSPRENAEQLSREDRRKIKTFDEAFAVFVAEGATEPEAVQKAEVNSTGEAAKPASDKVNGQNAEQLSSEDLDKMSLEDLQGLEKDLNEQLDQAISQRDKLLGRIRQTLNSIFAKVSEEQFNKYAEEGQTVHSAKQEIIIANIGKTEIKGDQVCLTVDCPPEVLAKQEVENVLDEHRGIREDNNELREVQRLEENLRKRLEQVGLFKEILLEDSLGMLELFKGEMGRLGVSMEQINKYAEEGQSLRSIMGQTIIDNIDKTEIKGDQVCYTANCSPEELEALAVENVLEEYQGIRPNIADVLKKQELEILDKALAIYEGDKVPVVETEAPADTQAPVEQKEAVQTQASVETEAAESEVAESGDDGGFAERKAIADAEGREWAKQKKQAAEQGREAQDGDEQYQPIAEEMIRTIDTLGDVSHNIQRIKVVDRLIAAGFHYHDHTSNSHIKMEESPGGEILTRSDVKNNLTGQVARGIILEAKAVRFMGMMKRSAKEREVENWEEEGWKEEWKKFASYIDEKNGDEYEKIKENLEKARAYLENHKHIKF